MVRAEQKNHTLDEMGIFDDGPYEVGGESLRKESLVPVPANSYLGRIKLFRELKGKMAIRMAKLKCSQKVTE